MIRQYGTWELALPGKTDGNPFADYEIFAEVNGEKESRVVRGFYDGDGIYKVRFMPSCTGSYSYRVYGSFSDETAEGTFMVEEADSHGMVHADGTAMRYSDGTLYNSIGTTCYVWNLQSEERQQQTYESLKKTCFNKIRFCVFPKHYDFNFHDPISFPFEGTPVDNSGITKLNFNDYKPDTEGNSWDFTRINVAHFQMMDQQIQKLMEMGIEADIILFHPYDRWGFSKMTMEQNEFYLRYVIPRFAAYRNVWWSLANEYDFCQYKTNDDWEQIAAWIQAYDPYRHMCSIHNGYIMYDFSKDWVTHCSVQRQPREVDLDYIPKWLEKYNKPVVIDEMCYEGDIEHDWGNITAKEMVHRMWTTVVYGGHPGHGECYERENVWWSHGGILHGESYKRFDLLLQMMNEANGPLIPGRDRQASTADKSYMLYYFGDRQPHCKWFTLEGAHRIDLIDTWNMTVETIGTFSGKFRIDLPAKEGMALRIVKVD
ncbi:MAG: DUF5605 domain-containing protein [Lachnospiraceae bacterium]|nr:DUF5605 domain-containing protein [Lachnospiraceae bacterium]